MIAAKPWALPVAGGMQGDLVEAPDGSLLLSWVEAGADGQQLRLSRFRAGRWSSPVTITTGASLGNASDTPRVRQTPDGALWALWLRPGPGGGHATDVVMARAPGEDQPWSRPITIHDDGTPTEHGFIATWADGADRLGVAWLDGRGKGHHDEGDQMLRAASFDGALARHSETTLDTRACDCCHTDAAATPTGPVLVYRDRSPAEVRDIHVVRRVDGAWMTPQAVHADGWTMPGCPVNGPAVAAAGADVAVVWYTAAAGDAEIRMAVSTDRGVDFGKPLVLDRGPQVLGRVDVAAYRGGVAAVWLREEGSGQSLWMATLPAGPTSTLTRRRLAAVSGRGRGTGMPRLAANAQKLHVIWSDIERRTPVLRGVEISVR